MPINGRSAIDSTPAQRALGATFLIGLGAALGTAVGVLGPGLLPSRFYNDASTIEALSRHAYGAPADPSYESASTFYRLTGLAGHTVTIALLTGALFLAAMLLAVPAARRTNMTRADLALIAASFVLGGIYVDTYSKEAITLIAVTVMIPLARLRSGTVWLAGFAVAYALAFRTYWLLVAALFVLLAVLARGSHLRSRIVVGTIAGLLGIAVVIAARSHEPLSAIRESLNAARVGDAAANSQISDIVPGDGLLATWLNSQLVFAALVLPVPLAALGSPVYLVSALFIAYLTVRTWRSLGTIARTPQSRERSSALRCLLMTVAMVVVQSIYVPDYGSALKHLTPILPLAIAGFCHVAAARRDAAAEPASASEVRCAHA